MMRFFLLNFAIFVNNIIANTIQVSVILQFDLFCAQLITVKEARFGTPGTIAKESRASFVRL